MYLDINTVRNFHDIDYLNFKEPVVVRKGCTSMKAYTYWSLSYLKKQFENTLVDVQVYKNRKQMEIKTKINHKKVTFNEFLKHSFENLPPYYYLAGYSIRKLNKKLQHEIQDTFDEIRESVDERLYCGLNSINGFHIHVARDFVLNQIMGKKTVYLYDYYDNPQLKMQPLGFSQNRIIQSLSDVDHNQLKLYKVTLEPGDSLVIPPWWFHAVIGHDFSCSVTKIYDRSDVSYYFKYKYLFLLHTIRIMPSVLFNLSVLLIILKIIEMLQVF